ncbi:tRNA (guanine(26)-N(2))-dimethyltransferase [Halosimplex salinum]|uniref:tRNA (guanine(26)-N(2))-dimethyltransferase n=1 Tax=Halosimplex salinum TaxID=1710538 RepID=UPI000F4655B7|nr:tRNA (guanine(26)-N(2))-dimethyltransferase [Halosimplex salinum]
MRVTEGNVEVEVPEQADAGVGEGVFFNPVQELNRDLTVAVLRALEGEREDERSESSNRASGEERPASRDGDRTPSYLDANAASGVRGVRAAAEGYDATLCDVDPDAVDLCRENLARNDLDGDVVHRDANAVMHEGTFDVVDIDPFGTPIPFADAAFRGATRLVAITATDTAPLCGAHFESGVRHYSTVPRNTEYHAEMGLRVLLSALVRTAARYDLAAEPVFSHATKHYARTYLRLDSGAQAADALIEELGYVDHCEHCLYREATRGLIADPIDWCPECGEGIQTAGPIWLGPIRDRAFTEAVRDAVDDGMGTAEQARDLCETVGAELDEPTHYDQHRLSKRWGVGATAMDEFLDRLRDAGHAASRTHYGGTTFKTDADVAEIRAAAIGD